MTQYIDKSALVAEIERRMTPECGYSMNKLLDYIDTLEVKEVNLEKELDSMITPELKFHKALPSLFDVAKHFFELGLQAAQKGEEV